MPNFFTDPRPRRTAMGTISAADTSRATSRNTLWQRPLRDNQLTHNQSTSSLCSSKSARITSISSTISCGIGACHSISMPEIG